MHLKAENNSFIDFKVSSPGSVETGIFMLSIEVGSDGFNGKEQDIQFDGSDIKKFLYELKALEDVRQGEAELFQISKESEYCPFRFKVFSIDKMGHMAVSVALLKTSYIGSKPTLVTNKLLTVFEIDPGALLEMAAYFRDLLKKDGN